MRVLTLVLALLAVPAVTMAQEAGDMSPDAAEPTVQLEESNPAPSVTADAPVDEVVVEDAEVAPDEPAMQGEGPESKQWWYLVGAIVVGGLIIALLL